MRNLSVTFLPCSCWDAASTTSPLELELVRHIGLLSREQACVAIGRFLRLATERVGDIEGGESHVDEHGDVATPQGMDANALDPPKSPHASKTATAIELWGRKTCAAREWRDRCRRVRGLESLAVAALRISQSTQSNQDDRLGRERRRLLHMLSFYSPLHAEAFPSCLGSK